MNAPDNIDESPVVYIVDDDDAVRDALVRLFDSVGLNNISYSSGQEFIDNFIDNRISCLVTDIRMPGMSGLDVQLTLKSEGVEIPVIIITGHGDIESGVLAMKNGAFDFVLKPFSDQALLDKVQAAIKIYADQHNERKKFESASKMLASLTKREHEILNEILNGHPNKRIADNLKLSDKTVEYHRSNIMKKMCARSLADLIKKALLVTKH